MACVDVTSITIIMETRAGEVVSGPFEEHDRGVRSVVFPMASMSSRAQMT